MCDYDFDTHRSRGASNHFTQVVWKASVELGIGKSTKGRCTYVVARYKPAGNWVGEESETC